MTLTPMHVRVVWLALSLVVAPGLVFAQSEPPATDLPALVAQLSSFDYPARLRASRLLRRAPAPEAQQALTVAVRTSDDEFIRYRALVLLTGIADRALDPLMRELTADRNDRIREVTYRWREDHPDPAMTMRLLGALETEQAEFVRPALIGALAAAADDAAVRRALVTEAGRGLDFFRGAVIDALGRAKATWAASAITEAAKADGPLQDDALIALGRLGDPAALAILQAVPARPVEASLAAEAGRCLLGDGCPDRITALTDAVTSRVATREGVGAGINALAALALTSDPALTALASLLRQDSVRDASVLGLGSVALRTPDRMIGWLESAAPDDRDRMVAALADAFESFEEDYAEERFYASARAAYWMAAEGSDRRTLLAALIDKLEF